MRNDTFGPPQPGKAFAPMGAALFGGYRQMLSGCYYGASGGIPSAAAFAAGGLCLTPLWVPHAVTISGLTCEVTAAVAASTVRLGLYTSDDNDRPGALILDAGTVDSSTTGVKEVACSVAIPAGLYWLAGVNQGGTPTLRNIGNSTAPPVHAVVGGSGSPANGYYLAGVTAALPATGAWVVISAGVRVMAHIA